MPLSYFDLTYTIFQLLSFDIHIWNIMISNIPTNFQNDTLQWFPYTTIYLHILFETLAVNQELLYETR